MDLYNNMMVWLVRNNKNNNTISYLERNTLLFMTFQEKNMNQVCRLRLLSSSEGETARELTRVINERMTGRRTGNVCLVCLMIFIATQLDSSLSSLFSPVLPLKNANASQRTMK